MASHANFVDIFAIVFLSDIWIIGHELKNTGDNMRKIHANVPVLFRPEPWTVTEERFEADKSYNNETIFTVGNGYLGVRGYSEEGVPAGTPTERSALINGVYEYHPYHHIWCRPGFPPRYHSVFAQADPFRVCVLADGELCTPASGGKYSRVLDMRGGTMVRTFEFRTSSGKRVNLSFERFASFSDVHVLMHRVRVSSPDGAVITAVSDFSLPGCAGGAHKEEIGGDNSVRFLLQGQKREKAYRCLRYAAAVSGFSVACALGERAEGFSCEEKDAEGSLINEYKALPGAKEFLLERAAAYYSDAEGNASADDALRSCRAAMKAGYDAMASRTAEIWKRFWDNADIVIDGDDLVQQGVRFSLFMLNSSVGRDGKTNIGANGLTGTGYMGHTFWDTEIFMTPAFLYTDPLIARRLLEYRYSILPNAEKRAAEMEDEGALYSWNSINGEECGHVFEAATAQYHLNCDIAFAIKRYYNATADWDFMCECGIEILAKMSKCISHRGNFIEHKGGKFCINGICGPDEYNPVVNNNLYTNWLARDQFRFTLAMLEKLRGESEQKYAAMLQKCGVDAAELERWQKATDNMYIAYDKKMDLYLQDDDFLDKDPIDVDAIPPEKLPLLTHLHPLNLWRYQVIKQADIVLLIYLYSHEFTQEMKRRIYDFYEPKTIHDSSLSAGIHCIVAQDIGYAAEAYGYLKQASRMDLDNVNRNTCNGVHSACQGSTYMMIVNGYAGMRDYDCKLHFKPAIPAHWKQYSFKLAHRGSRLGVCVVPDGAEFTLLEGEPISFECCGEQISLRAPGESARCPLRG